ncbi:hypothetical protein [Marinobacter sp. R17]|uniref:hypothetical protein n=1 Tax=Marinobacter sp. R17 TaxID=2484250 RepID=UPI000F4CD618|nr:hypothetical protein [Marinobacter sp. R17]
MPTDQFKPLVRLSAFVEKNHSAMASAKSWAWMDELDALYWANLERHPCWTPLTVGSQWFPTFQQSWHPEFSAAELRALGVSLMNRSIIYTDTPLRPWTPPSISYRTWWRHSGRVERMIRPAYSARLRSVAYCARQITGWVERHAPVGHTLTLADFTCESFPTILKQSSAPCPFCLAFALWWLVVTQRYRSPQNALTSGHIYFTQTLGYAGWPALLERAVLTLDGEGADFSANQFRPSLGFRRWFYERSLLQIFKELFDLSCFLLDRYVKCRYQNPPDLYSAANRWQPAPADSAMMALSVDNDRLRVWCTAENPLDNINITLPPGLVYTHNNQWAGRSLVCRLKWRSHCNRLWQPCVFNPLFPSLVYELEELAGLGNPWYRGRWARWEE